MGGGGKLGISTKPSRRIDRLSATVAQYASKYMLVQASTVVRKAPSRSHRVQGQWAVEWKMWLSAAHIPGKANRKASADEESSKINVDSVETRQPGVAGSALEASRLNGQCPRYVSLQS